MLDAARTRELRGVLAVASTYVFFLLFAQYGFVRLLDARLGGDAASVKAAMAAMGLSGLITSLATPALLVRCNVSFLLRGSFFACALAALASLPARGLSAFLLVAVAVGCSLAVLTVTLATQLLTLLTPRRLGLGVGLGTGGAYWLCNLPPVFDGVPVRQAVIAALAAIVGALVAADTSLPAAEASRAVEEREMRGAVFGGIVLTFLALVWIDSAVFNVIQETASLEAVTWESRKAAIAVAHLLGAVAAGWLLDRGALRALLALTFCVFLVSFRLLEAGHPPAWAAPLYAVGISWYSTALVAFPSLFPEGGGLVPRRWRAALLYGIGGWLGSALGVGMAQDLHTIPAWFLWAAGSVILGSYAASRAADLRRTLRIEALSSVVAAAALVAMAVLAARSLARPLTDDVPKPAASASPTDAELDPRAVARGRALYIGEGCINCHSQFLRPKTFDVEWWGPLRSTEVDGTPPLYGNRRQGPDLSNAGNRRSEAWHRQHLIAPRSVSPGSRMPSYGHLFSSSPDDTVGDGTSVPGEDLVAYLRSLGAGSGTERSLWAQGVPVDVDGGDAAAGRELFASYCATCHGASARGDGPAAQAVHGQAMNLRKPNFWLPTWGDEGTLEQGLARLVRFGLAGSSMPGHEWLTDPQLADLTAYLMTLPGTDGESDS